MNCNKFQRKKRPRKVCEQERKWELRNSMANCPHMYFYLSQPCCSFCHCHGYPLHYNLAAVAFILLLLIPSGWFGILCAAVASQWRDSTGIVFGLCNLLALSLNLYAPLYENVRQTPYSALLKTSELETFVTINHQFTGVNWLRGLSAATT